MRSVIVFDDEAQRPSKDGDINRWGDEMKSFAVSKGMPAEAQFWTKRNASGTATIFEWKDA